MKSTAARIASLLSRLACVGALLGLLACAGGPSPRKSADPALLSSGVASDTAGLLTRLILLGDAGDPRIRSDSGGLVVEEPVLALAQHWAALRPERTWVLFLGDNIYNLGMPETGPPADSARARLGAQVAAVVRSGAHGVFLPGNHDWHFGSEGILRQQAFVLERLGSGSFLPPAASGGPVLVSLEGVELIVLDTEWWLRQNRGRSCAAPRAELVLAMDSLRTLFSRSSSRYRVLLAHHPLDTYGEHRGMGVLRRLGGRVVGATQDLGTPAYRCMRRQLVSVVAGPNRPLVAAAGHEHSLQVLDGRAAAEYILVSGAGSTQRVKQVGRGSATLYAQGRAGLMVLDFFADRRVVLHIMLADGSVGGDVSYRLHLR